MKLKPVLCLAVLGFLLASCNLSGGKVIKAGEESNGQSIELKADQKLQVSLAGNPTTGYNWDLVEYDQSVLKQVGDMKYKADSKLIGSGGVMTFTFEALASGNTTIKLIYHRSWETDVPPEKSYELIITVK